MTELKLNLKGSKKRIIAMVTALALCFSMVGVDFAAAATTADNGKAAAVKSDEQKTDSQTKPTNTNDQKTDDQKDPTNTNDQKTDDQKETTVAVTGVALNASKAALYTTQTYTLKATVNPKDATNKTVTWKTSNAKVAKISRTTGTQVVVTGVKAGSAKITATAGGKTKVCTVTVKNPTVKLNATKLTMKKGTKTTALAATSNYSKDGVKAVKSSSSKVVKATNKGNKITLQAKKTGKATVTVTMKSGVTKTCKVTVNNKKVTTKSITLLEGSKKITKKTLKVKKSVKLTVKRNPINATEKVKFTSSKKSVATVSKSGVVKAKKKGTAVITAKTSNGKTAKVKITVKK